MVQKVENAVLRAFLKSRMELLKLQQEEDGMETLEVVILVAVAVVIAAFIIQLLKGNGGDGDGLLGRIFDKIEQQIQGLFDK